MKIRFRWPCWLLNLAWRAQATPHPSDGRFDRALTRSYGAVYRVDCWLDERRNLK